MHADRLRAQLLTGRSARDAVEVADRLLAVQAQDSRGMRLAVRSRSTGLSAGDVDRALTEDRSLLVTTLNRGTLHLVRSEDYWWLHPLTTPQLRTGSSRRLAQEGVSPAAAERGLEIVKRALTAAGPLTRRELGSRLRAAGVPTAGQALVHVLMLAGLRGLVVRGPVVGGEHAFVLVRDWLGRPPPEVSRQDALARLARRYLAGHGPAADHDLARWAGITLGDARRGLAGCAVDLAPRDDGLAALVGPPPAPRPTAPPATAPPPTAPRSTDDATGPPTDETTGWPAPALLGAFDPVLLGWSSREAVVGRHQGIVTSNGLFRPFAMVAGRATATWRWQRQRVVLEPFAPHQPAAEAALRRDAEDVERFLGPPQPATGDSRVARNASDNG